MNKPRYFIDTNILVYAFDKSEPRKQQTARSIIEKAWKGQTCYCISNQILAEFSRAICQKIEHPISQSKAIELINSFKIKEFIIIDYSIDTITYALEIVEKYKISFWDALIGATMLENDMHEIYSEDNSLPLVPKIKVVNPFK